MINQVLQGPFLRTENTTNRIMWDVVIALLPAWIAGVIFFGFPAIWIVLLSTISAIITEAVVLRYPFTLKGFVGDGSAAVTGMLLGLILPSTAPWWIAVIGSVFAILLGKLVFGGLGYNIFNPALVGRAILLLGFTAPMVHFVKPFDAVTTATPLLAMSSFDWSLVWGNVGGSIGETSVIAILLGSIYLLVRGHIGWRIPLGYIGTAFAVAWLWGLDPWMAITAGGLLFAAVFMATDMVTSPVTPMGRLLFGCGCGFLTIFLRQYTSFPEGVTFAILTMNAVVPLLDRFTMPVKFGAKKAREHGFQVTATVVIVIILAWGVLAVFNNYAPDSEPVIAEGVYLPLTETLGTSDYKTAAINEHVYYYVGGLEQPERIAFVGYGQGYHAPIYFYLVVDGSGMIEYIQIISHNDDPGLGTLITRDKFLDQFIGLDPNSDLSLGVDIQGITGATISSRAVIRGVNTELGNFVEAFYGVEEQADLQYVDGVYIGEANSFGGMLRVQVSVVDGVIAQVEILEHTDTPGLSDPAFALIPERIVETNNRDVDVVSQATITSEAIVAAVDNALAESPAEESTTPISDKSVEESSAPIELEIVVADGVYRGVGIGYDGEMVVEVTVTDGQISEISVVEHTETPFIANQAFDTLISAIIEKQAIVDIYTGATMTSEGLFEAIRAAVGGGTEELVESSAPIELEIVVADGVYRGVGIGYDGEMVVEVTVTDGQISEISVVEHTETPFIANQAFDTLIPAIIEKQAIVDIYTGATMTSEGLFEAIRAAVGGGTEELVESSAPIELEIVVADGVYRGVGIGYDGEMVVEVTVTDGQISEISVVEHTETPFIANQAFDTLIPAIIEKQAIVDIYTGATMTSEGLFEALETAVSGREAE